MGMRHVGAAAIAGTLGLLACASGGVESSCANYFDEVTAFEAQCGTVIPLDPSLKSEFQKYCDALEAAPGAKDLASQIDACANAVSSGGCSGPGQGSTACRITGSLPDLSPCGNGTQCAGGLCDTSGTQPSATSEVRCGLCASYLQVGATCSSTTPPCDPSTSECTNGTCTALGTQGQSCAGLACAQGLVCDSSLTCVPLPAKGESCTTTAACAAPYRCIGGTCTDGAAQGGACPTGTECAPNLSCDTTTHTCQPQQRAAAGQPCGFVNDAVVDCQSGLQCVQTSSNTFTCETAKALGESCTVGMQECQVFLYCVNGTCQEPDYSTCK